MNMLASFVAALVPMIIGFIWFNPKVFGNAWMKASGMTMEKAEQANMPKILILSFIFAFLVAFFFIVIVIPILV